MNEVLSPGPYLGFLCYLYFTLGPLYYFLKKEVLITLLYLWDCDISLKTKIIVKIFLS